MEINYQELLKMSNEERKDIMTKFLVELLGKKEEDQINDFQNMIGHIVKEYNDSEYIDLCKLCLEIIYSMDEKSTKAIMEARLEAQFELEDLFERKVDSTNLLKAIQKMPAKNHVIEILKKYGIMP
jgi:predicted nucleic acid-binding OB-fold protein